jgi:hypothetical protein
MSLSIQKSATKFVSLSIQKSAMKIVSLSISESAATMESFLALRLSFFRCLYVVME